ncbi:uncharacterized protein V6R79_022753 [Siganus canaliculatus]
MVYSFFRIFSFLLLLSAALELLILSWGYFSKDTRPTTSSEESGLRQKLSTVFAIVDDFWDYNQKSAPPLVVFNTTPQAKAVTKVQTEAAGASTHPPETPIPILDPGSFKELPQWDFEDVYNQDASPRPSTCARSLRLSEDKSFRESFLPNIRLFLHKDNINMSEWNRLSHFNNPFGFMGFKYDDVMTAVKLIPEPTEPLLPLKPGGDGCIRCAVVGTAGILNGSKMGKEIDGHQYVFRMNGAVIKGFEEDVGNRTSVYVHTAHSITTSLYLFKKYGYTGAPNDEGIKYVLIPEGLRDFNWLEGLLKGERVPPGPYHNMRPWTYYGGQYDKRRFYVLHQDFLRYVRNRFLKSPRLNGSLWKITRPTNGAFTLLLALQTCDIVSAYGFMTENFKSHSTYYFEKAKSNMVLYANHDYIMEKKVWADLHDRKILTLYQPSKTTTEGTEKQN